MELQDIKLNREQQEAYDKIRHFFSDANTDTPIFILKGYAGTGKTTLLRKIVGSLKDEMGDGLRLMAPTGRAALVLQRITGFPASTIHRAIYSMDNPVCKKPKDIADTTIKFIFQINDSSKSRVFAIVDEASMVSSRKSNNELFQFGTGYILNDLLTFSRISSNGRILFVGDPAQLPPVGDNCSCAMSEQYFADRGLKCDSAKLTEIMRQNGESAILTNAMRIRDMLKEGQRNRLQFTLKSGEMEAIEPENLVEKYFECPGEKVVVTYSNRDAVRLNNDIRRRKYGGEVPLQADDPLMVVRNNYLTGLMNGDLVTVESMGEVESQSAPVYVERNGRKERVIIKLYFQRVTVMAGGIPKNCLIILDLLKSEKPNLTIDEQKALFINFCMRNPKLNVGTGAFVEAMKMDPFFNALEVKYGYAITGHKSQGGEWDTVFVDYIGREGLDDDSLRWSYTVTTRAKKMLYITNQPNVTPFDKFHIEDITPVRKIPSEFRVFGETGDDPLHAPGAEPFLRAKCLCIQENMKGTPYNIDSVRSCPYREIYNIATPEGVERYDLVYNSGKMFLPAKEQVPTQRSEEIKMLLDDEHAMPLVFDYKPSDDIHRQLYDYISKACSARLIQITNVAEHNDKYYTMYYFRTSDTVSYLQVFINNKGFITYARPASLRGKEDTELQELIDFLRI